MDLGTSIDLAAFGLIAFAAALLLAPQLRGRKAAATEPASKLGSEGPIFLLDGQNLIDCNAAGRALLSRSVARGGDWHRLVEFLAAHFDNITQKLAELAQRGVLAETAEIGNGKVMLLQAEMTGGLMRITLNDPDIVEGPGVSLAIAHHAIEREVQDLRHTVAVAPIVMWRESTSGEVVWANSAYMNLALSRMPRGREGSWPLPRVFERAGVLASGNTFRHSIAVGADGTGEKLWFDLVIKADPAGHLCYAQPADAIVAAENNLRDFIDTLAKTFASLPIGLAVFDKDRVLQMFNPALVELTNLPPDFLARRPSLLAVLDAMRDRNLIPEPKDYRSWRRQIVELERAAASGLFQETWAMPDGQTFRVTGRPHPNGGLAMMIEDISTETQRSRRYRSDLEINQSVIDNLDDAIAVFNQSGQMMFSNAAYASLWDHDPLATMGEATIRSVSEKWKSLAAPTPLWVEIEEFIHTVGLRKPWAAEVRLNDGRAFGCDITPIAAGTTMIAFKARAPERVADRKGERASGRKTPPPQPVGKANAAR